MDIVDLREFYASKFGIATRRLIAAKIAPSLPTGADQITMGLGYAAPYLPVASEGAPRTMAFMLARQGVVHWPAEGLVRSSLVDEFDLPLLESTVDVALVVHGLELSDSPPDMLSEIWRVLAPQGRLILVVPNRRGLWSGSENSPFGYGQPFSRSQLTHLLKEARFTATSVSHALFVPPLAKAAGLRAAPYLERAGAMVMTRFSGVIVVEAMKQVYAFSSGKRARRLLPRFRPVLLPQPARREKNPG